MDPSWFETVPEPAKSVLIKVAGDVTMRLLDAAGYQVKKRFRDTPEQEALTKALAQGLYTTFSELTDDTDLVAHYVGLFGEWTDRDVVAGELSQLIDPRAEAELDLELLRQEFEALGYAPDMLGENVEFEAVVARFAGAFYDAAAKQSELQAQMQIGLLRGIAERAERQTQLQEQIAGAVAPDLTAEDESYLTGLVKKLDHLPLGGVDRRDVGPDRAGQEITLRKVYVDLDTTSRVEEEAVEGERRVPPGQMLIEHEGRRWLERPEGALEALVDRRRMVLLGDPGSGKTTFLRHVALACADTWLGIANENADLLVGLGEHLFPLVVTLRQFAAGLAPAAEPHRRLILEHLQKLLNCDQAPRTYWPTVRQRLHDGEAILLLDGYDEVDSSQRPLVAGIVHDLLDHFPALPVLITSRTRAYEAEKTPKFPLPTVSLADLSPEESVAEFRLWVGNGPFWAVV